ncbi:type II toxin-antitoxin system antitoxin SocA domain-containing protein [Clostridium psychrophilum]|uniref:type II toxin-antitoxin system antitoxin SocA domain-containing protein n=1 Tax=Clostridium psychrophilum TaxID=132926 RepID=UPI001C0E14B9|nr:type II toxin-antitoxin system antitoxin SocA domain-containing protein [Clostridium psychrophilum]MBU3180693.1 DUF4065 domain-containing protein [Clostridium psychrophilum]
MLQFCEKCNDTVKYSIREERKIKIIKGRKIEYIGKEAYCDECGSDLFVHEIRDSNLEMLDEAFREQTKLITVPIIENILDKYDIGKRPLSLLMGWGEGTLTRYLNGDMPTKQYSDILIRLLNNPKYMSEILEENKGKITEHAYNVCKKALDRIDGEKCEMALTYESSEKIDNVSKYILNNCSDITPLALQKLLYYAQAFYKVFNGQFLFDNDCEAWIHGPVYRDIYYKYKEYGYNAIEDNTSKFCDINLDKAEEELLDSIIINFGCYSGKILERMTHIEAPWNITRKELSNYDSSDRIIDKKIINEYFNSIKNKFEMLNIADIKDYSADLFSKVQTL